MGQLEYTGCVAWKRELPAKSMRWARPPVLVRPMSNSGCRKKPSKDCTVNSRSGPRKVEPSRLTLTRPSATARSLWLR